VEVSPVTQPQRATRIIVGLDRDGLHDDIVLAAALRQASLTNAPVSVVHAIVPDIPDPTASADVAAVRERQAARQARHQAATEDLYRHHGTFASGRDGPVVEYDVRYGDPATVLLAAAQHADLIVIGTHSTSRGSPLLLGTVSQDVAVHATCPVMLIPTP
jgi:nucleotide-binding universal stress UspA family protein